MALRPRQAAHCGAADLPDRALGQAHAVVAPNRSAPFNRFVADAPPDQSAPFNVSIADKTPSDQSAPVVRSVEDAPLSHGEPARAREARSSAIPLRPTADAALRRQEGLVAVNGRSTLPCDNVRMSDERFFTLRQADQLRTDIANLESGLE